MLDIQTLAKELNAQHQSLVIRHKRTLELALRLEKYLDQSANLSKSPFLSCGELVSKTDVVLVAIQLCALLKSFENISCSEVEKFLISHSEIVKQLGLNDRITAENIARMTLGLDCDDR